MTSNSDDSWLLEPPGSGEVTLHFAAGSDVELSEEARQALETLLSEITGQEVAGFAMGRVGIAYPEPACPPRVCDPLGNCWPYSTAPCFALIKCKIILPD
ncbi:MAG: hypothetical protein R2726_00630 [Acidimicrobiales bacterium]